MTMTMTSDTIITRSEVGLVRSKTKDGRLYRANLFSRGARLDEFICSDCDFTSLSDIVVVSL